MTALFDAPLYTARLRLEPVTAAVAALASSSVDELAAHLGAEIPDDWRRAGLPLVRRPHPGRPVRCVAIHRIDQRVVGDVRFEPADPEDPVYEIGYSIIPAYRRQGLATEACAQVIEALFADAGAMLIIGGCDRRNRASIKTLRKLGFWLDGSRGQAFWWRLTPELWAERDAADARA